MQTKHKSKACTDALHAGSGGSQAQTQAPVREKSPAGKKTTKDAKSKTCVKSARKQTGETCAMPHAAKGSGTEASEVQSVREGTNPDPLATKPDTVSDSLIRKYAWKLIDQKIRKLSRDAVRAVLADEIGEAALVAFAGQIYRIEERLRVMAAVSGTATDALTQSLRWGRYALSTAGAVDEAEALSTITFTTKDNPEEGIALALAKDAEWMWLAYQDKAKRLCLENEFNVSLREWLALVARDVTGEIAMLFHFMSYSCPQIRLVISAEDMARALEIGDVLIEHAQEAWSKLKKAQSDAPGKVLALVLRKGWPVFSARDCYQSLRRQLPFYSMKPMNKALASLVEQGCILPISMKGKNGRAMVRYELNPVPQQGREIKCPFVLGIPQTFSLTLTLGNS